MIPSEPQTHTKARPKPAPFQANCSGCQERARFMTAADRTRAGAPPGNRRSTQSTEYGQMLLYIQRKAHDPGNVLRRMLHLGTLNAAPHGLFPSPSLRFHCYYI